ncbi:hypothetical protein PR202_ga02986 [Eleusine coracana subsp. coracana]|uniref:Anaphase-promoting complex subunit 4 n=1 Tax=Eleusine coracana subsp. coracana TaxID=191504 RepID=A0AAV5BN51_ELECO|nr:hypothetical protein PR202_ga02986 [Eleusine coracana subsp. coracana]
MAEEQMEEASTATPFQLQFDKSIPFQIKMAEWNPEKDLLAMVTDDSKNGKMLRTVKPHDVAIVCLNWAEDDPLSRVSLSRNLQKCVLQCSGKLIDTDKHSRSNTTSVGLHCLHLDTSIFFNRKNELHQVSQQASSIQDLVEVVRASISLISKQWSSAMKLFHEKFSALPSLIVAHGAESSSEDEFLSLLFGTRTSPALHQFLASSLGEAGLKRVAKAIDSAGREIRGVVSEHLQPAVEIISFRLAELRGLARWRSRFQNIGLDEKLIDGVTESIGMLVVQVERFSRVTATVVYLDEDSQHDGSSYSLTDYLCFKIPDGSLNKRNCIGVIKDFCGCCSSLSTSSLSGFLLCIPDEYECVDLSLYKALDLQLDSNYAKVRSIPHMVSTPLAVSASRGVACVFSSRRHALVYILDEDEEEEEDEVSDME